MTPPHVIVHGTAYTIRPTFERLVAAEAELGPMFALVERAGVGQLGLADTVALLWHCVEHPGNLDRATFAAEATRHALAELAKPLRALLGAILRGQP